MSALTRESSALPEDQQPPRKKIRKGTRSCWECKHRKVRCHFVSDGDRSCRECRARGTVCRSQDLPEPENPRESDRTSLNDRLGRVEYLLERVLQRLGDTGEPEVSSPRAADNSPDSSSAVTPADEHAPVLSLFDNGVLSFRRSDASSPNTTLYDTTSRDLEKLRLELLALLPAQSTLERLDKVNSSWWLVRAQCFLDYNKSLLSRSPAAYSNHHPVSIAKALLWVVICLQQLPRGVDIESLQLRYPPTRLIAKCISAITLSISSDDALLSSIDGLECLVLQGIFYNNDGKLRSSWLSYRRALNVAQIIGLHRVVPGAVQDSESVSRAKHIWNHIINADRYLSLMLGVHHGIMDVALDSQLEPNQAAASPMNLLCRIAGSIIERNQRFATVTPSMVRMTQTIDSEFASIDLPPLADESTLLSSGKSAERAQSYKQLMTQLWYYQLLAWLHLPLFLESGTQRRYDDYSRQSCLEASRQMIICYTFIRRLTADSFCCKSLDFQAFTAAVTLMINILGSQPHSNSTDWPAVESVMAILEKLAEREPPDKVATRGLGVLQILKDVAEGNKPKQLGIPGGISTEGERLNRIEVAIPYFGTISLNYNIRGKASGQQQSDPAPSQLSVPLLDSGITASSASSLQITNPELSTADGQFANVAPWPETRLEIGYADLWTFDPELPALPPFLPDFGDNWDLGL